MINVRFITVPGCYHCAKAREVFDELKPKYPQIEIEEIDATTDRGMEIVSTYGIFQSPGIIINGKLFSTGALDKEKFIAKLEELK